ncbi:iron-sulfur cluster binding protein [Melioribacter roseus P3M-2]|uniref:Epoxyqueuosine reductase n=1 Tax=Melioribacter roseus (strain DSM 23840 / JCM 17771 / VKM B-2668 / P3M-2) TaxID=1191523 RepID=I6Z3C3_MELRP|nr:tRNA epoxyqueuosine(34) reductase QueG [Melioribacter roseus]AFN73650.1 iron-sulfur cluster binding protein [Melioribacter roseus P3M-2]
MKLTNEIVIEKAREIGFDLIGFAPYQTLQEETERLNRWLDRKYHAGMKYMEKNIDKRCDVKNILPEAKSIISLGLNYYINEKHSNLPGHGKISRYAWGKDYHLIVWDKLELLEEELKKLDEGFVAKSYVDTGPVMDKVWAIKSGIGWMGKHSNIINRNMGSWFFIATLINNREFEYSEPAYELCGACRACIDACPTSAIVEDFVVDSNKCISYLTIENKGEIPGEFKGKFDNWLFGCDVCQDVCPWNKKFSMPANEEAFKPAASKEYLLEDIMNMTEEEFKEKFNVSPIKRSKLKGLKRNAQFLIDSESN